VSVATPRASTFVRIVGTVDTLGTSKLRGVLW
jgi:hypothetical protein